MLIAITLTSIVITLLVLEKWYLNRLVNKIPLRILVNGTRGKSTVVKYISSLLRSNGFNTFSKITGIIPTIYYDDDFQEEIKRKGGARVTEQFRMIHKAVNRKADAIVLENMSIMPELQKIESSVLKPDYYILTNILEDHLEEFGSAVESRVEALCRAIPENCTVITTETNHLEAVKKHASENNSRVITFNDSELDDSNKIEGAHADNIKIVKLLAREENFSINAFYETFASSHTNESQLVKEINGFKLTLVNAFAANDVLSAKKIFSENIPAGVNTVIVFNTRGDRPYRTIKFSEWLSTLAVDMYFITGDNVGLAKRKLLNAGVDDEKVFLLNAGMCNSIFEVMEDFIGSNGFIFGCGNIKNAGNDILKCFRGGS